MAFCLVKRKREYRLRHRSARLLAGLWRRLGKAAPPPGSRLYRIYNNVLAFIGFSVEDLFRLKLLIFSAALLFCAAVQYSRYRASLKEIWTAFHYRCDLVYQYDFPKDEKAALAQEIKYLEKALREIPGEDVALLPREMVEGRIMSMIEEDHELHEPREMIANKVYYRLCDYHSNRKINLVGCLAFSLLCFLLPDAWVFACGFTVRAERKKELKFLKKLVVINGFIKPVEFVELLEILVEKARYLRRLLTGILDANRRNRVRNTDIYRELARDVGDIDTKLFLEKLDQANNYNFDQAIANIENEFRVEKRAQQRRVRKQVELIHAVGVVGFMLLIVLMVVYLITPWIRSYSMEQIF